MVPFPTHTQRGAADLIREASSLERQGRFEEGLLIFSPEWHRSDHIPDTNGLDRSSASQVILRFAVLLGYQGHYRLIADSQLRARDLLTRVLSDLEELRLEEQAAECENHIALTYARKGEFSEARLWLEAASRRKLDAANIHRLATIVYGMFVNVSEQRYQPNIALFHRFESAMDAHADDWIAPSFFINAAAAFIEDGDSRSALHCFEKARRRAERSSIWMHLGSIENETAILYREIGRFQEAHESVDRGIEVFRRIGDASREGLLLDTKAAIHFDQHELTEALATITSAIDILGRGENKGFLAEAITTKAKILAASGERAAALLCLADAVSVARAYSGESFALTLAKQFDETLESRAELSVIDESAASTDDLALVIPPELARFETFQAIRINNSHLAPIGIEKGVLVVAAVTDVERGDLAVVCENGSGAISCGFFDRDFGLICIEGCDTEPQLFEASDVKVIGKIVGIVRESTTAGPCTVEPLDLGFIP